jgi:hypothetical protein
MLEKISLKHKTSYLLRAKNFGDPQNLLPLALFDSSN